MVMTPPETLERPTWRDYLTLTKPKVISLLLFTTLAAMFIAAGGWPGLGLFAVVFVGGYMAAGSVNAFNMVIDRDIDGQMKRTATRPTVTAKIPTKDALWFAVALMLGSFGLLWWGANLNAALMAMAGLGWYVLIYTLYMKRRFWSNIVIGGAAGAFPPLVGWAAVAGDVNLFAWYLFLIVFFWTPVHFWALALLAGVKEDYRAVGIPMLPVVRGDQDTVTQIWLYTILTVVITLMPILMGELRWFYFVAALLLNALLVVRALQLYRRVERTTALGLYKYSMLYLALLFVVMAVDRAIWM